MAALTQWSQWSVEHTVEERRKAALNLADGIGYAVHRERMLLPDPKRERSCLFRCGCGRVGNLVAVVARPMLEWADG